MHFSNETNVLSAEPPVCKTSRNAVCAFGNKCSYQNVANGSVCTLAGSTCTARCNAGVCQVSQAHLSKKLIMAIFF